MIDTLVRDLAERYATDPTTPGIAIAWVNGREFYVAIHRYADRFGKSRYLLTKARGDTLEQALTLLTANYHAVKDLPSTIGATNVHDSNSNPSINNPSNPE